jgi:transcriptional regulator with XRE-family HTH domain
MAGFPHSTVARIERGKIRPTVETVCKLDAALERAEADKKASARSAPEMIRPRRKKLGLTVKEVAQRALLAESTVSKAERLVRKRGPGRATLESINSVLSAAEAQPQVSIGTKVRESRLAAGLTQEQFGELSNVSGNAISEIERGIRKPLARTLKKLRAAETVAGLVPPASEIRRRRRALRLTVRELASEARVSPATVVHVENGKQCTVRVQKTLHRTLDRIALARGAEAPDARLPTGEELRQKRIAVGLSQSELARQVGITSQGLWYIEHGIHAPRLAVVLAIERVLQKAQAGVLKKGKKTASLYRRGSKQTPTEAAQATSPTRERGNGQAAENDHAKQGTSILPTLTPSQHYVLDYLYEHKVFHAAMCHAVADIASGGDFSSDTLAKAATSLRKLNLVGCREGREGGYWLTAEGKAITEAFRK